PAKPRSSIHLHLGGGDDHFFFLALDALGEGDATDAPAPVAEDAPEGRIAGDVANEADGVGVKVGLQHYRAAFFLLVDGFERNVLFECFFAAFVDAPDGRTDLGVVVVGQVLLEEVDQAAFSLEDREDLDGGRLTRLVELGWCGLRRNLGRLRSGRGGRGSLDGRVNRLPGEHVDEPPRRRGEHHVQDHDEQQAVLQGLRRKQVQTEGQERVERKDGHQALGAERSFLFHQGFVQLLLVELLFTVYAFAGTVRLYAVLCAPFLSNADGDRLSPVPAGARHEHPTKTCVEPRWAAVCSCVYPVIPAYS